MKPREEEPPSPSSAAAPSEMKTTQERAAAGRSGKGDEEDAEEDDDEDEEATFLLAAAPDLVRWATMVAPMAAPARAALTATIAIDLLSVVMGMSFLLDWANWAQLPRERKGG